MGGRWAGGGVRWGQVGRGGGGGGVGGGSVYIYIYIYRVRTRSETPVLGSGFGGPKLTILTDKLSTENHDDDFINHKINFMMMMKIFSS